MSELILCHQRMLLLNSYNHKLIVVGPLNLHRGAMDIPVILDDL